MLTRYPNSIANDFNEYYINVYKCIASDIITKLNDRKKQSNRTTLKVDKLNGNILPNKPNPNEFDNIMADQILKAIYNFKNNLFPGFDKITSEILKKHNSIL